ncbi:hypothetical protein RB195_005938 [Necator americanus]|uniref:Uncharacterized protein n=1 Tax=Necator americanus TaxID=51031 RepID=A0ABR1BTN3_NECAM
MAARPELTKPGAKAQLAEAELRTPSFLCHLEHTSSTRDSYNKQLYQQNLRCSVAKDEQPSEQLGNHFRTPRQRMRFSPSTSLESDVSCGNCCLGAQTHCLKNHWSALGSCTPGARNNYTSEGEFRQRINETIDYFKEELKFSNYFTTSVNVWLKPDFRLSVILASLSFTDQ